MRTRLNFCTSLLTSLMLGAALVAAGCSTSEPGTGPGTGGAGTGGAGTGGSGTGGAGSGGSGSGGSGSGGSGSGGSTVDAGVDLGTVDAKPDTGSADMGGDTAAGAATFTELYMTIFGVSLAQSASSCAGAQCHNPTTSDGVNLSTKMMAYTTLLTKVKAGNPAGSVLMTRLNSTVSNQVMPRGRPQLKAPQIERVRSWIMAGAKND